MCPGEFYLLLSTYLLNGEILNNLQKLKDRNLIADINGKLVITDSGRDIINNIISKSNTSISTVDKARIKKLVEQMRDIYPSGSKDKSYYYKGNQKDLETRMEKFFEKYGNFTDEQILDATKNYVNKFMERGDLTFMRTLGYFMWKKIDGMMSSDLASTIERLANNTKEIDFTQDWTGELK